MATLDLVSLDGINFVLFIWFNLLFLVARYNFLFITDLSVHCCKSGFLIFLTSLKKYHDNYFVLQLSEN